MAPNKSIEDVVEELMKTQPLSLYVSEEREMIEEELTKSLTSLVQQSKEEGRKEEESRWVNQFANEHDERIRRFERKRIGNVLDEYLISWKEPEFNFDRHSELIDYTKKLVEVIRHALSNTPKE